MPGLSRRSAGRRSAGVATALLVAAVCMLALLLVGIPTAMGAHSYTVLTGSMRPTLEPGHLIAVRPTPISQVRVGDVITFQLRSGAPEVATHRVVGMGTDAAGERTLITRGDANNVEDAAPVRAVQLRGVLVYAVPWIGWITAWATPAVKSAVVTGLGLLGVGWGCGVLLRDARRRRAAVRTIARAAPVLLVALLAALSPVAAARADVDVPDDPLELSADGVTWSAVPVLTGFSGTTLVPGGSVTVPLWVRNASADPARLEIDGSWRPTEPARTSDAALASALEPPHAASGAIRLAAGETVRVPIVVTLAASAGNETRRGRADLDVRATLTQTTVEPSDEPSTDGTSGASPAAPAASGTSATSAALPTTGGAAPVGPFAVAVALVAIGIGLVHWTGRRRGRRG